MTPEQLIDLLAEAGMLKEESPGVFGWHPTMERAERFVKLIEQYLSYDSIHTCHAECQRPACVRVREAVQAEREACAKACADVAAAAERWWDARADPHDQGRAHGASECVETIRARGEK